MPSNSNPQIHCGEGPCSRGVFQAGCHAASSERVVHRATTGDPNSGRPSATAVCRTQLPATTAAIAGVEDSTIQTLGRWHSVAYLQYIRLPSEWLAGVSAVLAKNTGTA